MSDNLSIGSSLILIIATIFWIFGIAIIKGFWLTLFAILIPPYSWYIVAERILHNL